MSELEEYEHSEVERIRKEKEMEENIRKASNVFPSLWVKGMKNEAGLPLEFTNHRFLIDIYNDLSPRQVILKAPQIGATTMHILKALWISYYRNKQIIYTLPSQSDIYDMVSTGFDRIIANNNILKMFVSEGDTVGYKRVGNAGIRFKGTFMEKQGMMYPSNLNIHDEVDKSNSEILTLMETRLQASADGWRWYFSHPSVSGFGIDVYWQQSDKKEWFVTCSNGHSHFLRFPECIRNEVYVCEECGVEITNEQRINGLWNNTSDETFFSGYHISQMMCPWIPAKKIMDDYNDPNKSKKYFYNYVLGLPYSDENDSITKSEVLENVKDYFNDQKDRVVIGVDTGLPIYYVIGNSRGIFHFGKCGSPSPTYDPYKELESFLLKWPRSVIVSDQGGDLIGIRNLQQKYPGRVYLAFYRRDRKTQQMTRWGQNDEAGKVLIDRNTAISWMVEQLKSGNHITFNGTRDEWSPFAEHFTHIVRTQEEGQYGTEYKWVRNGADHYLHALLYTLVGLDRFGEMSTFSYKSNSGIIVDTTDVFINDTITGNELRQLLSFRRKLNN